VATILYNAAKTPSVLTPDVLGYLTRTLADEERAGETWLSAQAVGNALYGLQSLGDSEAVRRLAGALAPKVRACRDKLTGKNVGNALYGLRSLGDSAEIRMLVAALTPKVKACGELRAGEIGMAMYGLQSMGDCAEVRELVATLTPLVQQCREPLSARNLGSALIGLQTLGDSAEVRGMLAALTPKVEACREQFESQAVVGSLYCLQGKRQSPEVRGLCRALTPKVESCDGLNLLAVRNALAGFRGGIKLALGDSDEVSGLVMALAKRFPQDPKRAGVATWKRGFLAASGPAMGTDKLESLVQEITSGDVEVDGKQVASVLYSAVDAPTLLTPTVVETLTAALRLSTTTFSAPSLGNALHGLQAITDRKTARALAGALVPKVQECPEQLTPLALGGAFYAWRERNHMQSHSWKRGGQKLPAQSKNAGKKPLQSTGISMRNLNFPKMGSSRNVMAGAAESKVPAGAAGTMQAGAPVNDGPAALAAQDHSNPMHQEPVEDFF
jgi:hypothetical protein